ncbi:MAG: CDP-diacylglycerol--glycerol-3-phosphate 3-phosphatidyltransferase [Proteobacteria bacterium]|nr:CDP-diacylglycerol--glycerol-3-phosphate 3-phosphatidyltransferase [Pseudomonadota bacterium]MBU1582600.1 CDP-diacylglycerol--glycerol-3-phosphate 3-phosphatidyltransferase [Pseudomonadota bacterium]MBU2452316.1 CDP-diacylglycerol--glycerol-3-phosphate 3-phosphatidyltransferase [Pseudomonadota bacterium]MBU2630195.1 CDP-diacylglycerol--glycerol-3-phosphate 3-phosphatidyltransferase [Pseudomonadota bacterium]
MTGFDKVKKVVLTPNFMTLSRIVAVPAIVILLMFDTKITTFIAAALFSVASITDYLDGYLARTRGLVTKLGKLLDPLADKLLVSSTLVMLVSLGFMEAWIACVIIGRELSVTGLRCVLIENGQDVAASWLGKYKTGFQIAAIIPLTMHYNYLGINFNAIGQFFLYGALIFTVWSGFDYFIKARKFLPF